MVKRQKSTVNGCTRGISLLEILIVVAIIALLGAAGAGVFRNTVKGIELEETARTLIADLKDVRAKALSGEDDLRWGIHAVNDTNDYYELFSTPTNYADAAKTVSVTTTFSGGTSFSDPVSGSKDIIFSKGGGTTTASSLAVTAEGRTITITITAQGAVY